MPLTILLIAGPVAIVITVTLSTSNDDEILAESIGVR